MPPPLQKKYRSQPTSSTAQLPARSLTKFLAPHHPLVCDACRNERIEGERNRPLSFRGLSCSLQRAMSKKKKIKSRVDFRPPLYSLSLRWHYMIPFFASGPITHSLCCSKCTLSSLTPKSPFLLFQVRESQGQSQVLP